MTRILMLIWSSKNRLAVIYLEKAVWMTDVSFPSYSSFGGLFSRHKESVGSS